tara:strand:- start:3332 stop:4153 length:822 start_codon:yes stop_codon:yes gene_type:complete
MSQDDNHQTQEQPAEAPAPDGLMAAAALAEDKTSEENQEIGHLAEDSQPAESKDESEIYERPEWFPEKHWDEKEGPDLEGMVKSQKELEQKFHHGDHKPPKDGNYDLAVLSEAGVEMDDPVATSYLEWAQKYNINQAAFSELAETITSLAVDNGAAIQADIETERKALGANADAIIKSNIDWADGLERKGVISEQERAEINMWGGTAIGQRLMQKVRNMTGDMSQIPIADVAEAGVSEDDFRAAMQSKMADPRYGSDMNYTRQVEAEFQKRYG